MTQYSFTVGRVEDIDVQRIVDENEWAIAIFVIGKNALLLLAEQFLAGFEYEDCLVVARQHLRSCWGANSYGMAQENDGVRFSDWGQFHVPDAYRALTIKVSEISLAVAALEKALAYERKIKVRVSIPFDGAEEDR